MADILTKKSTKQVILRPADGSGRSFVLFGLASERVQFNVASPTRRTLSQVYVTQQRRVSRRRFTLTFSIFEPNIQDSGRTGKLDRSGVYEQRGSRASTRVTAREQLEMIHSIAKLHERGILLSYQGLSINTPKAAIVEFNADVVYATGTGTITLEERPEKQIDIENIAITVEAAENALKKIQEDAASSAPAQPIDLFSTTPANTKDYLMLVHSFQAEVLAQDSFTPYIPNDDQRTLTQYGLARQPLSLSTDDGTLDIFPRDPSYRIPKLRILPLAVPAQAGGSDFNVSIATQGLFIDFRFKKKKGSAGIDILGVLQIGGSAGGDWECTAMVFSDPIPLYEIRKEDAPLIDPKADVAKVTPSMADPRTIAFREENKGRFKDAPRHVISVKVEIGREVDLADNLTFAFMPKNNESWKMPRNEEIGDWAIVLGDYRPTST